MKVSVGMGDFYGIILTSHQNEHRKVSSDLGKLEKTLCSISETHTLGS